MAAAGQDAGSVDSGDHVEMSLGAGLRQRWHPEDTMLGLPARRFNEAGLCSAPSLCLEEDAEDSTTDGNADDVGRALDDDLLDSASPLSAGAEPSTEPKFMLPDEEVQLDQEVQVPSQPSRFALGALVICCIASGCACQAPYEVLNSQDKGCAHLISLAEHVFGILVTLRCAFRPRQLPLSAHLTLAAGSIGYTQLQNAALGTKLPTLVLITIKNGNLAANIFLGKVVMKKQYGLQQLAAVLLLSSGLLLLSFVGAGAHDNGPGDSNLGSCLLGMLLLAGGLLSRAAGALAQEHWAKTHAIPVEELLFFRSLFGLPAVLMHAGPVVAHGARWVSGTYTFSWPGPWVLLSLNTATFSGEEVFRGRLELWTKKFSSEVMDYGCRVCIGHIIERTSALTANLILTFQRFISFVLSAAFFAEEEPGRWHWLGAVAVLAGTLLYAAAPACPVVSLKERRD
ncbi:Efr [Symbiodinium natans]|uniref:Efr protein n=1 Tax=Symbiodinium natans TaxID=878477 RepID=A0A812SSI9_9DINO|nr:Efr [Symbiodinium natans]